MPTLADIYSGIDTAKRKAGNFIRQPLSTLQEMIALGNDQARLANQQTALSAQGARREMRGQPMTQEQALADQELQQRLMEQMNIGGMTIKSPAYGITHRPMNIEQGASPLHDLSNAFDDEIYGKNAAQYYGTGSPRLDNEAINVFKKVRNNPIAEVTIYRAVPKKMSKAQINEGDWVTVSKEYAMEHGEGTLNGDYKIIAKKVPASHVTTNADSILEQGYYPVK